MRHVISQTPLRISLFGGGTDYPIYYQRKPGAVLGFAIDRHIFVSVNTVSEFFEHRLRISYSKIEEVSSIQEIEHPCVKACLALKNIQMPLDIHISADLPAKTGLGSSSSFTVGLLHALDALQGNKTSKQELAEQACYIEQSLLKENVGSQDPYHAAFGGLNVFEFYPKKVTSRPLRLPLSYHKALEEHLMIFYTGQTRFAHTVLQEQVQNTKNLHCDKALKRLHEMVFEAEDIFASAQTEEMISLLGSLLLESWQIKKTLSSQISTSLIDGWIQKALDCGAYGGKLCGAGGGGFLVFLVPKHAYFKVQKALNVLPKIPLKIDSQGSSIVYMKK